MLISWALSFICVTWPIRWVMSQRVCTCCSRRGDRHVMNSVIGTDMTNSHSLDESYHSHSLDESYHSKYAHTARLEETLMSCVVSFIRVTWFVGWVIGMSQQMSHVTALRWLMKCVNWQRVCTCCSRRGDSHVMNVSFICVTWQVRWVIVTSQQVHTCYLFRQDSQVMGVVSFIHVIWLIRSAVSQYWPHDCTATHCNTLQHTATHCNTCDGRAGPAIASMHILLIYRRDSCHG